MVRGQWSVIRSAIGLWCVESGVRVRLDARLHCSATFAVRELTVLLVISVVVS